MKAEDRFRQAVIRVAQSMGGHVTYIESHQTSAGVPDLHIFLNGTDVWLELKVVGLKKVRVRPTQRKWHRERREAGGNSWVWVLDPPTGNILQVPGHVAADLEPDIDGWRRVALVAQNIELIGHMFDSLTKRYTNVRPGAVQIPKPNRDRAAQDPGSAETTLSESGADVVSHHWLTDKH